MAKGRQANMQAPRPPLRLLLPAGGALVAVLLVAALVGPSLIGGDQTGGGGPAPNASAVAAPGLDHHDAPGGVRDLGA